MSVRKMAVVGRRNLHKRRSLQIGILVGFWVLGELAARAAKLPVPGGIIGLFLVLVLLSSRRLSPASLRLGADLFITEMLLFFIPAVLAVIDHKEFMGPLGLKVLAVILCGTIAVMGVTAVTADVACRWYAAHGRRGHGRQ